MLRVSNKHQPFLCRTFSQAGNLFEGRRVRQHQLRRSLPGIAGGAAPRRRHRNSGKRARDFGARGGVQRKAAQTASGEERTSKSVLSCGQFLDKVSIDGMAKPRGKSVKSTANYIQKSCQLGKNSWGLRSLNRGRSGRSPSISFANITFLLSFPLSCHTFWRCQGGHFSRAPRPK